MLQEQSFESRARCSETRLADTCHICRDMTLEIPLDTKTYNAKYSQSMLQMVTFPYGSSGSSEERPQSPIPWRDASYAEKEYFFHYNRDDIMEMPSDVTLCDLCQHWFLRFIGVKLKDFHDRHSRLVYLVLPLGNFVETCSRSSCHGCRCIALMAIEKIKARIDPARVLEIKVGRHVKEEGRATCSFQQTGGEHGEYSAPFLDFCFYPGDEIMPNLTKPMIVWDNVLEWMGVETSLVSSAVPTVREPSSQETSSAESQRNQGYNTSRPHVYALSTPAPEPLMTDIPCGFRLIDVSKLCIIEIHESVHFAALSYVWGPVSHELVASTSNIHALETPGRLRASDVPQLVKDSIQACVAMKIQFLWIDRLCIIQDDSWMKTKQLEAMGRIYQSALVTLVSLESNGVTKGLPGVSYARNAQLTAQIGPLVAIPKSWQKSRTIEKSAWATRGWTYQEGLLAQKLLVFGEDMLYLYQKEDLEIPRRWHSEITDSWGHTPTRSVFCCSLTGRYDTSYRIQEHIESYTRRVFTFEGDILNGFLGVLSQCGQHYYGIPHNRFDQLIRWIPEVWTSTQRITMNGDVFPSWSWTSALGPIKGPDESNPYTIGSLTSWFIRAWSDKDQAFRLQRLEQAIEPSSLYSDTSCNNSEIDQEGDRSWAPALGSHLEAE